MQSVNSWLKCGYLLRLIAVTTQAGDINRLTVERGSGLDFEVFQLSSDFCFKKLCPLFKLLRLI
jgi:hypothetical protein